MPNYLDLLRLGAADSTEQREGAAEIERLQAIVDKLPKCWRLVDGKPLQDVPMYPGMGIYYVDYREGGDAVCHDRIETVSSAGWTNANGICPHFLRDGSRPCFSTHADTAEHLAATTQADADRTRAAAEAARKGESKP